MKCSVCGTIHTFAYYFNPLSSLTQVVSRRPFTEEVKSSQVKVCGLCGGCTGTGTGFPPTVPFARSITFQKRAKPGNHPLSEIGEH